ncbi:MAG: ABC transporter ATP-binding protein [Dehalococcoidia bacterium]|nr:MAG: ABC transporter ATP-binding protein [Dehalococcoidia bacterium]
MVTTSPTSEVAAPADPPVLELRGLTKRYGALTAVSSVDLNVSAGEILGLLGPNGSGKSTTLNLVMGFIRPTAGEVIIDGHSLRTAPRAALQDVGGLVEGSAFYPYLSGRLNLEMIARLRGLPTGRVDEALELVDLTRAAQRRFGDYSQGMRQRLGVAGALMHHPRLVVLDEPTSGLDPAGTREMRELLPRIASAGTTVILASHLLTEVEQVCTRVAIMQAGAVIASGTIESLMKRRPRWRVRVPASKRARALEILQGVRDTGRVQPLEEDLFLDTTASGSDLNRALLDAGIIASEVVPIVPTLESIFMELTVQAPAS